MPKRSNTTKLCKAPEYMHLLDPRARKMHVYNNWGHNPISVVDIIDTAVLLWRYLCYNNVPGKANSWVCWNWLVCLVSQNKWCKRRLQKENLQLCADKNKNLPWLRLNQVTSTHWIRKMLKEKISLHLKLYCIF